MPDTIEMPYQAEIIGAEKGTKLPHTYRLGGQTCLAGDVMGDYAFDKPLSIGQRIMFDDMSHYTMVKQPLLMVLVYQQSLFGIQKLTHYK